MKEIFIYRGQLSVKRVVLQVNRIFLREVFAGTTKDRLPKTRWNKRTFSGPSTVTLILYGRLHYAFALK